MYITEQKELYRQFVFVGEKKLSSTTRCEKIVYISGYHDGSQYFLRVEPGTSNFAGPVPAISNAGYLVQFCIIKSGGYWPEPDG